MVIFKERDALITNAVRSVSAQTQRPLELLIFDNNPQAEGRACLLQSIAKLTKRKPAYDFLYISSQVNIGFAKAHNTLIRKSRGDFILFLNADACLDAYYIERAIVVFAKNAQIAALQPIIYRM